MQDHFKNEILKVYFNDDMPVLMEWLGLKVASSLTVVCTELKCTE